jgi:hypothetical protein
LNFVTKGWQNISRQLCCSGLGKRASAAIGDSRFGIYMLLAGSTLQTSPLQPLNEILYRFNGKPVPFSALDTRAYKRFGTDAFTHTQAAVQ